MTAPKKTTAVEMLQPSRLRPTQLELLGDDVDLSDLYLMLNHKDLDIIAAVTDVLVDRTIEGASTVTVSIQDQDRLLLRSGRLSARNDIQIDGLYFRLVSVSKSGPALSLVFEDREISVLREYNKPIKASLKTSRKKVTRAEFVLRMLREPKELPPIPYVIPELKKKQPIGAQAQIPTTKDKTTNRNFGIPKKNSLLVKSEKMTETQRQVANTVLDVGASMVLPRKELVMAIMCSIQESTLTNLRMGSPGDYNYISADPAGNPIGVFQQIPKFWKSQGGATRDVAKDARAFYNALVKAVAEAPNGAYQNVIEMVQRSGNPSGYAAWRTEAERIVSTYGAVDGSSAKANAQRSADAVSGDYEFYRGIPPTSVTQKKKGKTGWGKESSWDCMQRLASEVQWRCFFVSGVFYFISDDDLFKSKPIAVISEDTPGVLSVDGDYDEGSKNASVTLTCLAGRWVAPPGSVVQLEDEGPWNGRWLVNDISRSLFNPTCTIQLKKPLPRLPEPAGSNLASASAGGWTGAPAPQDPSATQYKVATALVQPVPRGYNTKIIQGVHETAGLPGYPAADFGANAGAPVLAVESGKIVRLSGVDPAKGPWDPILKTHGPFGWNIYLLGDSGSEYFYTHLGSRSVIVDQRVAAGHVIATVGDYAKWGGANHTHVGVHPGGSGHPNIYDLMKAPLAAK